MSNKSTNGKHVRFLLDNNLTQTDDLKDLYNVHELDNEDFNTSFQQPIGNQTRHNPRNLKQDVNLDNEGYQMNFQQPLEPRYRHNTKGNRDVHQGLNYRDSLSPTRKRQDDHIKFIPIESKLLFLILFAVMDQYSEWH